ncbi:uncharacterized protein [Tiliqua scincoides]|uniref:uncharacterized protein n=1 Tax=Tiliqua scincoides TaxID=71010 RepID=UPI00346233F6
MRVSLELSAPSRGPGVKRSPARNGAVGAHPPGARWGGTGLEERRPHLPQGWLRLPPAAGCGRAAGGNGKHTARCSTSSAVWAGQRGLSPACACLLRKCVVDVITPQRLGVLSNTGFKKTKVKIKYVAISAVFNSVIHHLQRVLDCTDFPKTGVADQLSGSGTERRRSTFSVMKGIRQHFRGSVYCLEEPIRKHNVKAETERMKLPSADS